MFFFICNVALHLYQKLHEGNIRMQLLRLINANIRRASVVLQKSQQRVLIDISSSNLKQKQELIPPECTTQLWADESMEVMAVSPCLHVDLSRWTSYLSTQNYRNTQLSEGSTHILLEIRQPDDPQEFLNRSLAVPASKRVKVMDLIYPIAWKSGTPFSIVAECSTECLVDLGLGLKEGCLMLDDMLELNCISTVLLQGHAINLLRLNSLSESSGNCSPDFHSLMRQTSWVTILDSLHSILDEEIVSKAHSYTESNESLASLHLQNGCGDLSESQQFVAGIHGQHNQLSRHKNMIYESDSENSSLMGDTTAGETISDAIDLLAPEILAPAHRSEHNRLKPPNVLIYCGKKDSSRQYEVVKSIFSQCLNPDKYAIYHLKHEHVKGTPWMENLVLLVIVSDNVYDGVDKLFFDYFTLGGSVMSFGSAYDGMFVERIQRSKNIGVTSLNFCDWRDVAVICGRYVYKNCEALIPDVTLRELATDKTTTQPFMLEATHDINTGVALLSQIHLDKDPVEMAINPDLFATLKKSNPTRFNILRDLLVQMGLDCSGVDVPDITTCYLMATDSIAKTLLLSSLQSRLQERLLKCKNLSMLFCDSEDNTSTARDIVPVKVDSVISADKFDMEMYKRHLATAVLGHVVLFAEVVNSTMDFIDGMMFYIPEEVGLIAIASRQTSGQGRGDNTWLSPLGCAMFSINVRIPTQSELGQRAGFLQHIASLAAVLAVNEQKGYEDIDLRLKWPNDIYYGKTMKMGGVLVKSSIMADVIYANIGCGFNISNKDPTVCVNDLIAQHNVSHGTSLSPLCVEQQIALTVVKIEHLIEQFQKHGREVFVQQYYSKWLHRDAVVHIEATNIEAKVIGVDEYGFLAVQTSDGTVTTVHPDGNSFDMMRNLIVPKFR